MLISELSRRSGVPVATIKYYLREGLLPKGEATSATRSAYGEAHLRRLRLIRALVEVAGVPIAAVRRTVDALDTPGVDLHYLLGTVQYALTPEAPAEDTDDRRQADRTVDALLERLGWRVWPDSPARGRLAWTVATLDRLGYPLGEEFLDGYAAAAHRAAEFDIAQYDPSGPREFAVERLAASLALMGQALEALHRLAQEDVSARTFRDEEGGP